ncbi:hypothetical protein [Brevibacillus panacihumi]|uniref:hypothetical protein n=1 Tax=Brevibacillus panacihumi TaxID=497735 RepID=UPI003D19A8C5
MWEVIVKVAGEGGGNCLYGLKLLNGSWVYSASRDERILAEVLDEVEWAGLMDSLYSRSNIIRDWSHVATLLGRSFFLLSPRVVHSEFNEKIWAMVSVNNEISYHRLRSWAELCFPEKDEMERRLLQINN